MSDIQSGPPPPGGDQSRAGETYGIAISFTILSTVAVATRMHARISVIHNVGWDDYTIVLSQVLPAIHHLILQPIAHQSC